MIDLKPLTVATQRLNVKMDEAGAYVQQLETTLVEIGVGVDACVEVDEALFVMFRRVSGSWRICVTWGDRCAPWIDWSRKIKLETLPHLPKLIPAMLAAINELQELADRALPRA